MQIFSHSITPTTNCNVQDLCVPYLLQSNSDIKVQLQQSCAGALRLRYVCFTAWFLTPLQEAGCRMSCLQSLAYMAASHPENQDSGLPQLVWL